MGEEIAKFYPQFIEAIIKQFLLMFMGLNPTIDTKLKREF